MNRFMVLKGFGSLSLFFFSTCMLQAESPGMPADNQQTIVSTMSDQTKVHWHDSMRSGWAEAKRRQLPMVIYITSDRCRYCDAMKRDTWCDGEISKRLSQDFVAIRLTPQNNSKTLQRIDVKAYPTTLIGIPEGKIIDHRVGYQPSTTIHHLLSQARMAIARR